MVIPPPYSENSRWRAIWTHVAKWEAILFLFGCSEVNSTWLITLGIANQRTRKSLFTNVWYILRVILYIQLIDFVGWTTESLLDWGQFFKLAISGMVMICIEWWSFEVGAFLAGTVVYL